MARDQVGVDRTRHARSARRPSSRGGLRQLVMMPALVVASRDRERRHREDDVEPLDSGEGNGGVVILAVEGDQRAARDRRPGRRAMGRVFDLVVIGLRRRPEQATRR